MSVDREQSTELRCANHPSTVTYLRCGRCGKPICVRCVIQTPVGGRCKECAQLRSAPILVVGRALYGRAAAYGLAVAVIGGALWASMGSMFGLSSLLLILLGYAVGEAVSRGANRKIGRGLVIMAGGFTLLGVVVGRGAMALVNLPSALPLDIKLGIALQYGIAGLFGNMLGILFLVLALVVATSRVR